MPKKELTQAVRWEAKNAIPFSIDEALMDFEVLDEVTEKGAKKLVVAVAAAPQETVNRLLSLFSKVGITVSAMIPISLGLQNLISSSKEQQKDTIAIVEMGAAITELNIYREGRLAFSRKLPVAGANITKSLTSTLMSAQGKVELSIEEAEKIKKERGVLGGEGDDLIDGKISPGQVLSLVRPCVEQLAGEIERSFDFYREESRGGRVNKIILFGGGSNLKGLAEFLHAELEIDIEIGNAFDEVQALPGAVKAEGNAGTRFDLAVGAALNKMDKINLLPVELKEKTRRSVERLSLDIIVAGVVASLLLSYIGLHVQLLALNKKGEALKLEQRTVAPKLKQLRAGMMVSQIVKDKPYWEDVLKEIGNVMPAGIYLTYLGMSDDTIRLRGEIIQGGKDAQEVLSHFMLTLEKGIFQNVSLVTTQQKEDNAAVSEFEIICKVE